jgi:hypothetical protein
LENKDFRPPPRSTLRRASSRRARPRAAAFGGPPLPFSPQVRVRIPWKSPNTASRHRPLGDLGKYTLAKLPELPPGHRWRALRPLGRASARARSRIGTRPGPSPRPGPPQHEEDHRAVTIRARAARHRSKAGPGPPLPGPGPPPEPDPHTRARATATGSGPGQCRRQYDQDHRRHAQDHRRGQRHLPGHRPRGPRPPPVRRARPPGPVACALRTS